MREARQALHIPGVQQQRGSRWLGWMLERSRLESLKISEDVGKESTS